MEISEVKRHPHYGKNWAANFDIALLKMKENIEFTKFPNIRPICLPENSENDYNKERAIVTGWGKILTWGEYSGVLRKVELSVMSNSECSSKYEPAMLSNGSCPIYNSYCITHQVLCAQGEGADACTGDSGATNY